MDKVYSVIFKEGGKNYFFKSNETYKNNNYVIVKTEKGLQFAKITNIIKDKIDIAELKEIERIATNDDYDKYLRNLKDADKALKKCIELARELNLKMKITSAQYTFDRNQLLYNFTADERIDFRELAKKLAAIYHTRIELHQIGARDKAKEIGGIGLCGKKLCCNSFLKHIETVSMNMAKNQNLALNPSKINGLCGRLLCCLSYEDEQYLECSKGMPRVGDKINTKKGLGVVDSVDILNRKYLLIVNDEKEEIFLDDNRKK